MKCLLPLFLIALLVPARGRTAGQPDWEQLQRLLGQPVVAKRVVDFIKTNGMGRMVKGSSGMVSAPDRSYTVMFERDTVETIVLHAAQWIKALGRGDWAPYTNALPAGLSPGDNRKAVERKLGSPAEPRSDQWEHGELTIWVLFGKEGSAFEDVYVWRTRDKLVTLYAATAAEQKTATQLVQRIQAILPKGWTAAFEQETARVEFKRIEPLLRIYSGPNASIDEKPFRNEYGVGFRVAPYVEPSDYSRVKAENERLRKEANALCEGLSKGLGPGKDGTESSLDAEKRALARLDQIKKSIRKLPDYYFRDISLDWEFPMFTGEPYYDVKDPEIRKECERAQRDVLQLLSKYEVD